MCPGRDRHRESDGASARCHQRRLLPDFSRRRTQRTTCSCAFTRARRWMTRLEGGSIPRSFTSAARRRCMRRCLPRGGTRHLCADREPGRAELRKPEFRARRCFPSLSSCRSRRRPRPISGSYVKRAVAATAQAFRWQRYYESVWTRAFRHQPDGFCVLLPDRLGLVRYAAGAGIPASPARLGLQRRELSSCCRSATSVRSA